MNRFLPLLKVNAGSILLLTNVLLIIALAFIYDPFDLIQTGYAGASPIIPGGQKEINKIEIFDPDISDRIILLRKEPIANQTKKDKKNNLIFNWELNIISDKSDTKPRIFKADQDRVKDFFEELTKSRRYYSIKRSQDKEKELEFTRDKSGKYICMRLRFHLDNGNSHTLYLGKSLGEESNVRLDEKDEIFLIETNLKRAAGSGELYYFRNRSLISKNINEENIKAIDAKFSSKKNNVSIVKSGKDWQLTRPVRAAGNSSAIKSLLDDIIDWKANAFLEKLPDRLDQTKSFILTLTYTDNLDKTGVKQLQFNILGQKDMSTYIVRDEKGILYQITSVFLNDFFVPAEKLIQKKPISKIPIAP